MRLAAVWRWVGTGPLAMVCGVLLLSACGGGVGAPADGAPVHQQLDIRGFSYSPPSPIHVGDFVRFTAAIYQPDTISAQVYAVGEGNGELMLDMRDDGISPDVLAGDNIYTTAVEWPEAIGVGIMAVSLEVRAMLKGAVVTDKRLVPWLYVDP
jgi:hypothetical protein